MTSNDLNPTACSPRGCISDLTSDNVNADNVNAANVHAVNKNAINENAIDKLTASVIVFLAMLISALGSVKIAVRSTKQAGLNASRALRIHVKFTCQCTAYADGTSTRNIKQAKPIDAFSVASGFTRVNASR